MSAAPTFNAAGELLYTDRMWPWTSQDQENGWALAWLCAAAGTILGDVFDFAETGWDDVMDPDTAPAWFLPHLAMWAGVKLIPAGLTVDQQRARVKSTDGLRRGTLGAIVGAGAQHLTGMQRVVVHERTNPADPGVDHAYHLTVQTYSSETPDQGLVEAALLEQKPVGLVLHYLVVDENSWDAAPGDWDAEADMWNSYSGG